MTIVAEKYDYVIGIDTHARTHTYAIIKARTGTREDPCLSGLSETTDS